MLLVMAVSKSKSSPKKNTKTTARKSTTRSSGGKRKVKTTSRTKRNNSSIIRHIFGSSYKRKLAIIKAREDASKLNSKQGIAKYLSAIKKHPAAEKAKNLPVVVYTIITAMDDILGSSAPHRDLVVANILSNKSSLVVKLNRLIVYFNWNIQKLMSDSYSQDPNKLRKIYGTYKKIKELLSGRSKGRVDFSNPEVSLNLLIFILNTNIIYQKMVSEKNEDLFKKYMSVGSNSDGGKLDKLYLELVHDILLCDIDNTTCNGYDIKNYNFNYDEMIKEYEINQKTKGSSNRDIFIKYHQKVVPSTP